MTQNPDVHANWKAADMDDRHQWMTELDGEQVDEIDRALHAVLDAGITVETLARSGFAVSAFDAVVPEGGFRAGTNTSRFEVAPALGQRHER